MPTLTGVDLVGLVTLGLFAGWLGALVGIGGGVVIVPALVLLFGFDIKVAVAASLVSVVATSTAAGSVYVGEGLANMRLGMTLEIATTLGGISGGLVASRIPSAALSGIFAVLLVVTAVLMVRGGDHGEPAQRADRLSSGEGWEDRWPLGGAYHDVRRGAVVAYRVVRLPVGSSISYLAGMVSGLLGVGGGFLKVPAMHTGMGVPIKVAAATSNFMIGVTAVASLFIYLGRGYVHPYIVGPLVLGVLVGALVGTRSSGSASPRVLQRVLALVLLVVALQMGARSLGWSIGG